MFEKKIPSTHQTGFCNTTTTKKETSRIKSKFEWTFDDIRIEKIIISLFEVSAQLYVRHCPKPQSCALLRKTNDAP